MTARELNRDIKRLNADIKKNKSGNMDAYFKYIGGPAKQEFIRLYYADTSMKSLSKESVLILLRLNLSHRFIPLHIFGLHTEI